MVDGVDVPATLLGDLDVTLRFEFLDDPADGPHGDPQGQGDLTGGDFSMPV